MEAPGTRRGLFSISPDPATLAEVAGSSSSWRLVAMSVPLVLILLSPLLLLICVAGLVIVVALTQAAESDVPAVFERCATILRELCRRLPHVTSNASGVPVHEQELEEPK